MVRLEWGDDYTENIRVVSLTMGLTGEGILNWRGLKLQEPLYTLLLPPY